jgi:hypothetical protein
VDLNDLDPTEFEEFCFELLRSLGFVNLDWRKGTGLTGSPSDRGRDIVAQLQRTDIDATEHFETWFVECKHYKKGVPPEKLHGALAWAAAERPNSLLVIVSNFLSNASKDHLADYERNNRPPLRIKDWERPTLERLVEGKDDLLRQFLVNNSSRRDEEIIEAEQEYFDRVWYNRKEMIEERVAEGKTQIKPEILEGMRTGMREVEARYGADNLGPYDDFEWGMVNGKLSALRWVLGEDWDMLDT